MMLRMMAQESSPALVGHVFDIGSHISDVTIGELAAESGHRVLAVGHLVGDGGFVAVAVVGQVGIEGFSFEGALTVDNVAATHVAGDAVGGEDLTAVGDISSKGRSGAEEQGTAEGQQAKQTTHRA